MMYMWYSNTVWLLSRQTFMSESVRAPSILGLSLELSCTLHMYKQCKGKLIMPNDNNSVVNSYK